MKRFSETSYTEWRSLTCPFSDCCLTNPRRCRESKTRFFGAFRVQAPAFPSSHFFSATTLTGGHYPHFTHEKTRGSERLSGFPKVTQPPSSRRATGTPGSRVMMTTGCQSAEVPLAAHEALGYSLVSVKAHLNRYQGSRGTTFT